MTQRKAPTLRTAVRGDAKRLHELIEQHAEEGRLLPRELHELAAHADRFVVAIDGRGSIVACGELAPLSHSLALLRGQREQFVHSDVDVVDRRPGFLDIRKAGVLTRAHSNGAHPGAVRARDVLVGPVPDVDGA